MFYIRTADKLQRRLEKLPGGMRYLWEVILEDKLGICASLEAQMGKLVGTFFDEWSETVADTERRRQFQQFANTKETTQNEEIDREQQQLVLWAKESVKEDFKNTRWTSLT